MTEDDIKRSNTIAYEVFTAIIDNGAVFSAATAAKIVGLVSGTLKLNKEDEALSYLNSSLELVLDLDPDDIGEGS